MLTRIQDALGAGRMPTRELVDGGLIIFAGALMLTPGFVTDIFGFLLLIPPTRALVRAAVMRRFKDRLGAASVLGGTGAPRVSVFTFGRRSDVFDTTAREQGHQHELP